MPSWEDMENKDSFWEYQKNRAKEAMNDREVGILGQCEAAKDYEELSKKTNNN